MKTASPEVESFLNSATTWQEERLTLRQILLGCGLSEDLKWGKLCYSHQGGNVALIFGLKTYCAVGFLKGELLKDPKGILVAPGAHSQAMRQIRFTGLAEIVAMEPVVQAYIREAIAVEQAGLSVDFREKRELNYPPELQARLDGDPALKAAFEALTPGRQRGYVLHVSGAKQSATRVSRIDKCAESILAGKGLNER